MEILRQLQADLLKDGVSLSTILRKARVLASQLRSEELSDWVSKELDGYKSADELPDYRILKTASVGTWTNGHYVVHGHAVPMHKVTDSRLEEALTICNVFDGIRAVEQYAKSKGLHYGVQPTVTAYVNTLVGERGYGYLNLEYVINPGHFEQILDTVKNRLLDFVLKLDESWHLEDERPPRDELSRLVSIVIYNHPQGGHVSVFDQRGQSVNYQYNAAGNINIASVHDRDSLLDQLAKLKDEVTQAKQHGAIDDDTAVEAEYHILQASKEAKKEKPDKDSFLSHIGKAKDSLQGVAAVANLVSALLKIGEAAGNAFS